MLEPTDSDLQAVLQALKECPKPVLVHCTHGEDRTGLVVALYRMQHGDSPELAYADMVRHGFHPYAGVWQAWLRRAGWLQ
jgi:protein tyrosine/serine phosphatase